MRFVKIVYERKREGGETHAEEMLAVGDIRQTPEDIIHWAFKDFFGDQTETVQEGTRYEGPGSQSVTIRKAEPVSPGEAKSLRRNLFTKFVNRNITEKYAPMPYTGKPRPPGT